MTVHVPRTLHLEAPPPTGPHEMECLVGRAWLGETWCFWWVWSCSWEGSQVAGQESGIVAVTTKRDAKWKIADIQNVHVSSHIV